MINLIVSLWTMTNDRNFLYGYLKKYFYLVKNSYFISAYPHKILYIKNLYVEMFATNDLVEIGYSI